MWVFRKSYDSLMNVSRQCDTVALDQALLQEQWGNIMPILYTAQDMMDRKGTDWIEQNWTKGHVPILYMHLRLHIKLMSSMSSACLQQACFILIYLTCRVVEDAVSAYNVLGKPCKQHALRLLHKVYGWIHKFPDIDTLFCDALYEFRKIHTTLASASMSWLPSFYFSDLGSTVTFATPEPGVAHACTNNVGVIITEQVKVREDFLAGVTGESPYTFIKDANAFLGNRIPPFT